MTNEQQRQIAERRAQFPDIHKANYNKAMRGRSLRAATKAFCLECVCWQKEEVRECTDLACPLYPYRPYRRQKKTKGTKISSKQGPEGPVLGAELTESAKRQIDIRGVR